MRLNLVLLLINWAHEGHKLSWNDPVQVPVVELFVVLILLVVEVFECVPAKFHSELQALPTVLDCAVVRTVSVAGVPEGNKDRVVAAEHLPYPLGFDT